MSRVSIPTNVLAMTATRSASADARVADGDEEVFRDLEGAEFLVGGVP